MAASTAARAGALPSVATSTGNSRWGMALLAYARVATLPSVLEHGLVAGPHRALSGRSGLSVETGRVYRRSASGLGVPRVEGGQMSTVADLKARVCAEIDRRKGEIVAISEHI